MHDTAYEHGRLFFDLYCSDAVRTVVELGSQDVNGALRDHAPPWVHYVGLDVMPAKGVDLIVDPERPLPLATGCADVVVTSSAFEHDVCFWDTFLELIRILRPGGLLYVNAPSNGEFHRYPLDCWRFYPDAGVALVRWAARRGVQVELIESFIGQPKTERWADFVAVFRKAGGAPLGGRGRIADRVPAVNIHGVPGGVGMESRLMPDMVIADTLTAERDSVIKRNENLEGEVRALTAALANARAEADALRGSIAWRLTAPLRGLARMARNR